jgi:NAD(P)-dependent dehydrogenase (short-subunit alcohol dehydrogenase family)
LQAGKEQKGMCRKPPVVDGGFFFVKEQAGMGPWDWDEEQAERYRRFQYDFRPGALEGRLVVLAGGTGGLGAATAILLASEGARLVLGYRANQERAERLAQAIEERCRQRPLLVAGDLAQAKTLEAYREAVGQAEAPLYGAVIFPGDPARGPLESLDQAAMEASARANYIGPLLLGRDLGGKIEQESHDGSIVVLATMQALAPFESSLNYATAKAALVQGARILAKQWKKVRVNVIAPGATVAGMAAESIRAGKYDAYRASGAVARFGRPEDVARAARFFLEPDNYTTGQVLLVDGGLTLRQDRG